MMISRQLTRLIFLFTVLALLGGGGSLHAQETKKYQITAKKYEFSPDIIQVNQGDTVVLEVTATDRKHGLGIAAYNIDKALPKGETVTIEFVADKKSEFTIKCTTFCGWGHFGMKAKLIVS